MKNWKKIFVFISVAAFAVFLTACADSTENTEDNVSDSENVSNDNETQSTLIAYFSYTGNTEEVAQQIAEQTGGTLVEIERATPYEDASEEGEEEIENNVHPEITVDLDSVDDYDTIFVGYPIWFDEAPMVIDTFLESFDFSGKTIVPFCTSASDSIDNSLHIFSELAPDAVIADGLTANDEADIEPWLNKLGY